MAECFMIRNPGCGMIGQHSADCAFINAHFDGAIRVNGHATHHVQVGITKEHPHGSSCLNSCGSCAKKFEKRSDCVVTEGAYIP